MPRKEVTEGKRRLGVDFLTLSLMFGIIFILSYLQGRSMGAARLRAPAAAPAPLPAASVVATRLSHPPSAASSLSQNKAPDFPRGRF